MNNEQLKMNKEAKERLDNARVPDDYKWVNITYLREMAVNKECVQHIAFSQVSDPDSWDVK